MEPRVRLSRFDRIVIRKMASLVHPNERLISSGVGYTAPLWARFSPYRVARTYACLVLTTERVLFLKLKPLEMPLDVREDILLSTAVTGVEEIQLSDVISVTANHLWTQGMLTLRVRPDRTIRFHMFLPDDMRGQEKLGADIATMLTAPYQFREEPSQFDVYLCYNSEDLEAVAPIASRLVRAGVRPWFDKWHLRPGTMWQSELETQIANIRCVAIIIGPKGTGPWQELEIRAFLIQSVRRGCRIIPVFLRGATLTQHLPVFLDGFTMVDLRDDSSQPFDTLLWGITGRSPNRGASHA